MGISIKKDIATSLTSLIYAVILVGGIMVSFSFLEFSLKNVSVFLGIILFFSTILNFTMSKGYFQKGTFFCLSLAVIFIATSFFLNTPNNSSALDGKVTSPVIKPIKNSFIILGNNISIVKDIQKIDSKEYYLDLKPIS